MLIFVGLSISVFGSTEIVSVSNAGLLGSADSGLNGVSVSAGGRFIAFSSGASNLVAGDANGVSDIFVRDRQTGKTEMISVSSNSAKSNADSINPAISADGRCVTFTSAATTLVNTAIGGYHQIFLRDRLTGKTELASIGTDGSPANSDCDSSSISMDGRYVAFVSSANNLVAGVSGTQIYVRDRKSGTTEVASTSSSGVVGNAMSANPSISLNGRFVAFASDSTNLVASDKNAKRDIFLRDRQMHTTSLVSVTSNGTQGSDDSDHPCVNGVGRVVAFSSKASNLTATVKHGIYQIYARDMQTSSMSLISASTSGTQANGSSYAPSISSDGRFIAFYSNSTNLISGYQLGYSQVFVRDRQAGSTEMSSVTSAGVQGNANSTVSAIAANGRFVSFASSATNFISGQVSHINVYAHDRGTGGVAALPVVSFSSPTVNSTYTTTNSSLAVAGIVSDDLSISSVKWANDRGGNGVCTGTTSWSTNGIALLPGVNVITVTVTDVSGNVGTATLTATLVDSTSPTIALNYPTSAGAYSTTLQKISIRGTSSDNVGVTAVTWTNDRGGSGTCVGTTNWSASGITLGMGVNVITVTASDAAGNRGSTTLSVTVTDKTAPTVNITAPTSGAAYQTTSATLTISGTSSDNVGVASVIWANSRGGNGSCVGSISWSASGIILKTGLNKITVTASDAAGNSASVTLAVTYTDPDAPIVTITTPTTNPAYGTNATILDVSGTAASNVDVSEVAWESDRGGTGLCVGASSWIASGIALQPGKNVITISATDIGGHVAVATLTVNQVDTSAITWKGLSMISLPIIPSGTDPKPIVQFRNRAFYAYLPESNKYAVYPETDTMFDPVENTPGKGFWAQFDSEVHVPIGEIPAQDKAATIHLLKGWNVIGQPFASPVTWDLSAIKVQEGTSAPVNLLDSSRACANCAWGWMPNADDPNTGNYFLVFDKVMIQDAVGKLAPWQAFWILAFRECDLILPPPGI